MKYVIFFVSLVFLQLNLHSQWIVQNSQTTNVLNSVNFVNINTGWVVGNTQTIKTTNRV